MIVVYHGLSDTGDYRTWVLDHHDNGYVLNRHWETPVDGFGGDIHRASCHFIQGALESDEPLSAGRYKACSTDLAALTAWGEYVHRATPPGRCTKCP
jgi:hypothetical protein